MLLPNAERALIDRAKIRDYLLSLHHPVGRFKARFFTSLGFTDWKAQFESLYQVLTSVLAFVPMSEEVPIDISLLPALAAGPFAPAMAWTP